MADVSGDRSGFPHAALIAGATATGTYLGLTTARYLVRQRLPAPAMLPKALAADARTFELPSGRMNYYVRPGTGTPVVLLHSFNAAASPFEIRPVFERLARDTERPLYAVDWLGFGRSTRRNLDYRPALYEEQLYRFLEGVVDTPADLVALSLGCEYAARVALQAAPLVRRLALVSPTGLSAARGPSTTGRLLFKAAAATGVFELFFYRLTRRASLRSYLARQVFLDAASVPDALLDYAHVTAHAKGAHYAPRRFVDGSLFIDDVADRVYAHLYRPTLLLTPSDPVPTVQRFDRLPEVLDRNARDLRHVPLPGGLLPHWEVPEPFFDALIPFLTDA